MISPKKILFCLSGYEAFAPYQLVFYNFKIFISSMPISFVIEYIVIFVKIVVFRFWKFEDGVFFFLVLTQGRKFYRRRFGDSDNFILYPLETHPNILFIYIFT
jgi:hypothetical protein